MAKTTWFDESAQHPTLHERVEKLESFTSAMADGIVDKKELEGQEQRLTAAMKQLEPKLSDELHEQVTKVMIELTAYNVMRLLHELQTERVRMAVASR
jgi:glutamine synthetase adenylyltransferase